MSTGIAEPLEHQGPATPALTGAADTARLPAPAEEGPGPISLLPQVWSGITGIRDAAMDYCVPAGLAGGTEPSRRARLITGFGLLGFIFGGIYSTFYLLIGHIWGAAIVGVCSIAVASAPLLLRATGSTRCAANFLTLILLVGFGSLCGIEGGVRGHAIGWLAAVPLCALLLVEGAEAAAWCLLSVAVTASFVILDLYGIHAPLLYPEQWHQAISATGYLGLTIFMSVLGLIFEGGRRRAFARTEGALASVSEANIRLKKLDAEKNEFLGVAAHDLKNPLNIVLGYAELIAAGRNGSPQRDQDDARYIIEAADRMISIITQLLDVNAIEHGRFPIEIAPCDLGLISRQVASSYSAAAEKKQISVYAAGAIEPAQVLADSKAAYRILDNLLSNAIKYSPPGGDVYVRIRNTPEEVVWEVQDQGAGLSEADQARLYQKFTKLSARPTGGESSTGLGLSIVKMLAEVMGGAVACKSKLGEGSTFSLRLPAQKL